MRTRPTIALFIVSAAGALAGQGASDPKPESVTGPLRLVLEAEERVYQFEPADNGAGPMWCSGSTCLVRANEGIYASGLETLRDAKPLNNCRWLFFHRDKSGWQLEARDLRGRTREPSPLAAFYDGHVFLSANPTLTTNDVYSGPARPEILEFAPGRAPAAPVRSLPLWKGSPEFTEHSYRSFAADGAAGELVLFQNIGYTHAEWTFRDRAGNWSAQGELKWPIGKEYPKPEPIRICYPNVALKGRAVYLCGVSDIVEPYPEWRAFKKQLTGKEWDYDFRRLFYTWTGDITREKFSNWIEIASRDKTCGWLMPGDLWVAPDGAAHIVWSERALDERLRPKFFPDAKQSHALNYAVVRDGKVVLRRTLLVAREGKPGEVGSAPRFHVTPHNSLFLVFYASGTDRDGESVSENRIMQILPGGDTGPQVRIPFTKPFVSYFTTTVRGGSPPSTTLELLGNQVGQSLEMSYGRVRIQ